MKLGRLMTLALLGLALPRAALVNSTPQRCSFGEICRTGVFEAGTLHPTEFTGGSHVFVAIAGNAHTITLTTSALGNCFHPNNSTLLTCPFNTGTVSVFLPGSSKPVFTDTVAFGNIFRFPNSSANVGLLNITAFLAPANPGNGTQVHFLNVGFNLITGNVVSVAPVFAVWPPEANVFKRVPEPSALEGRLFGMGVLGLVAMMRLRLKLGI